MQICVFPFILGDSAIRDFKFEAVKKKKKKKQKNILLLNVIWFRIKYLYIKNTKLLLLIYFNLSLNSKKLLS